MYENRGVIIALPNIDVATKVESIVVEAGYRVLDICNSGNDIIRKCITLEPEIIVIGYRLTDMTILDVYEALADKCSFLAIVNETHKSYVQEQTDIFCISNPINKSVFINSLDLITQSNKRVFKLREKVSKLELSLEERKIIEKAKGLIMLNEKLTESEAFRYLQKESMDNGYKMIDFADRIIKKYKVNS